MGHTRYECEYPLLPPDSVALPSCFLFRKHLVMDLHETIKFIGAGKLLFKLVRHLQ
jgi:hypothetical protein